MKSQGYYDDLNTLQRAVEDMVKGNVNSLVHAFSIIIYAYAF